MNYIELTSKNLCGMYFLGAQKRHVEKEKLFDFYKYISHGLREKLPNHSINILCSSYYLSQMVYDYDDIFQMDEEQVMLKNGVSPDNMNEVLAYMPLTLFVPCLELTKEYFNKDKTKTPPRPQPKRANNDGRQL